MWSDKSSLQSSILTGVVLLVFGIVKARVSGAAQTTYDYIFSAVTTMFVGGAAAGVAYGVVAALEGAGN
jgi:VIT1/CCC1 family predicted Fe2+/Mn2+ transporter